MTLHNANLKKRIMTAMVTGVMATGAVVSAPLAEAANENTSSQQIVGAYEKLSGADLARYDQMLKQAPKDDQSIDLLPSSGPELRSPRTRLSTFSADIKHLGTPTPGAVVAPAYISDCTFRLLLEPRRNADCRSVCAGPIDPPDQAL